MLYISRNFDSGQGLEAGMPLREPGAATAE
jgi:hypothetical protein